MNINTLCSKAKKYVYKSYSKVDFFETFRALCATLGHSINKRASETFRMGTWQII